MKLWSGRTAPAASKLASSSVRHSAPTRLLVFCGLLLVAAVAISTGFILSNLRSRALADSEREVRNIALVLAEHTDRAFQALDLVQTSLIDRMQTLGISSIDDYERQMSSHDVHLMLKDKIASLPQVAAVILINSDGKVLNFSRSWPIPAISVADREHFKAFQSDAQLTSYVSKPERSRGTGIWTIYLARKLIGPGGEFLGVVTGAIELAYFERFFGSIALGAGSGISLFRRDGVLLARFPPRDPPGSSYSQGALFTSVLSRADQGVIRLTSFIDGEERLIAGQSLTHYPVVVAVATTVAAALADWRGAATYMSGVAVLLMLVIGAIVLLSLRQIKNYELFVEARAENDQKMRLGAALNNMRQGLLMFDSGGRLVLYNQRYLQMYHLSSEAVKPGCTLADLLRLRRAAGTFKGDPDQYVSKLVGTDGTFKGDPDAHIAERFDGGKVETKVMELPDRRVISITNQLMPDRGWVSMHEDITDRRQVEAERDRNREFLNLIIENVPVPVFVKDASERRYVLLNRAAEKFWGIQREEMIGRTAYDIFPRQDAYLIAARDDELVRSGELNYGEREMRTPRNGIRFASSKSLTISDHDGKPKYLIGVLEDATERRRLERERDRSQTFLNTIIENVPAPIFVKEASGLRYVLVNRAGENFWGISRDKMLGKTSSEIFAKEEADLIAARDEQLLQSGQPSFDEREFRTPCNGVRSIVSKRLVMSDDDGKSRYVVGVIEDVTERKLAEAQISNMARRDALTGIANRTVLHEWLEEALARLRGHQEAFTVLMLDLDGFKYINDSLGHAAGDELLKELAHRLQSSLDDSETVARLGGDEFAIIQASKINQREEAIALAIKVLEVVARPFDFDGHNLIVETSVGIALAPENGTESGELLKKADLALYRTKSEGRNSFSFFDEGMSKDATTRHQLLSDLRGALSRNEFELYYQPVIDAKTVRPCGAEALVRWNHPVEGLISPDRFIWLAEESGLMEPLGEWIPEKACLDALSWPEDIKVTVNISAAQFRTGKLFDVILRVLAKSGLPPERLEVEITESILLQNKESYSVVIQQLKDIGISIVLDDFGTGYCSLSYLTRFAFDKVKIDKSFTQGLTDRADCAAVVASVLTLARGLDVVVTAEGVETKAQFRLLRAAGVNQVQGYLFGRPVPLAQLDFSALERKWQAEEAA
jgi:diguanylate cyclase (GGDEF)-like protein/PAS domain S-box-containing protein